MAKSSKAVHVSAVIRQADLLSFLMVAMHHSMSDSVDGLTRLTACHQIQRYWYHLNQEQRDLLLDELADYKMDAGEKWEDPSSKYRIWSKLYDWMGAQPTDEELKEMRV